MGQPGRLNAGKLGRKLELEGRHNLKKMKNEKRDKQVGIPRRGAILFCTFTILTRHRHRFFSRIYMRIRHLSNKIYNKISDLGGPRSFHENHSFKRFLTHFLRRVTLYNNAFLTFFKWGLVRCKKYKKYTHKTSIRT